MRLSEILSVERVGELAPAGSKDEVLRRLAELFGELSTDEVFGALRERELLATTGVGSGVAVPHGRVSTAPTMQGALGICRQGIDFRAVDGLPVHIFVVLVAPDRHTHLNALARIARLLRSDELRASMIAAPSAQAAFALLMQADAA